MNFKRSPETPDRDRSRHALDEGGAHLLGGLVVVRLEDGTNHRQLGGGGDLGKKKKDYQGSKTRLLYLSCEGTPGIDDHPGPDNVT